MYLFLLGVDGQDGTTNGKVNFLIRKRGIFWGKPPRPNPKAFIWTMTIYREMDKAQKAAGLKHFNFHYFRHS